MTSMEDVLTALAARQHTYTDELALHDSLADALTGAGIDHHREVRLTPRDRIDLLAGRTGIEVKVAGNLESVTRQLLRYSHSDAIDALVLVTTKAAHSAVPRTIGGKPLGVHSLIGQGL